MLLLHVQTLSIAPATCSDSESCSFYMFRVYMLHLFRLWTLLLLRVQTKNPAPSMCSDSVYCSFHLFTLWILLLQSVQTLSAAPATNSDSDPAPTTFQILIAGLSICKVYTPASPGLLWVQN
jgi:hypothetical protein